MHSCSLEVYQTEPVYIHSKEIDKLWVPWEPKLHSETLSQKHWKKSLIIQPVIFFNWSTRKSSTVPSTFNSHFLFSLFCFPPKSNVSHWFPLLHSHGSRFCLLHFSRSVLYCCNATINNVKPMKKQIYLPWFVILLFFHFFHTNHSFPPSSLPVSSPHLQSIPPYTPPFRKRQTSTKHFMVFEATNLLPRCCRLVIIAYVITW